MPKVIRTNFNISHTDVLDAMEYANEIASALTDEQLIMIDRFKHLEIYQQDILMLSSQGYSLREIGAKLDVSYFWVLQRLREIRNKLDGK